VTLPALHVVNEHLGYVPEQAVVEVAELLELAPAQLQDTLSFYGFFKQDKPQGRVRVWVCRSISCAARGGEELLEHLCEKLGIRPGETTPDGRVTLEFAECLGACDYAPAMLAGDVLHKNLTKEKIDEFVASL
jgi:NADH-quinone oxidoreductase subunit E